MLRTFKSNSIQSRKKIPPQNFQNFTKFSTSTTSSNTTPTTSRKPRTTKKPPTSVLTPIEDTPTQKSKPTRTTKKSAILTNNNTTNPSIISPIMKVTPDTDANTTATAEKKTRAKKTAKSVLKNQDDITLISDEDVTPAIKKAATAKSPKTSKPPTTRSKKAAVVVADSSDTTDIDNDNNTNNNSNNINTNTSSDTTLLRRRSTKTEIDHSVSGDHINTKYSTELEPLTRKMGKDDDHEGKTFKKQINFDDDAKSKDNLILMTWNVAGFRGAVKNGFWDKFASYDRKPDVVCLQEMKIQQSVLDSLPEDDYAGQLKKLGYEAVYNLGDKAGYSGVGVWYLPTKLTLHGYKTNSTFAYPLKPKAKPVPTGGLAKFFGSPVPSSPTSPQDGSSDSNSNSTSNTKELDESLAQKISEITGDNVNNGMRSEVWNCITEEGRIVTVDFGSFYLVTTYVPNSGQKLDRLPYRHQIYEPVILEYLLLLQEQKPVMYSGDLNAARDTVDVHQPTSCQKSAGFQAEERERLNRILFAGFKDVFREVQGDGCHGYTYWSHRFNGRENDRGWRIDYWLVSEKLQQHCKGSMVTDEFKPEGYGGGRITDHAPLWVSFDGAILKQ